LLLAMIAIGANTSFSGLCANGWRPIAAIILQSLALVVLVSSMILFLR
jgi:uncharacterized membrane protein YadS